MTTWIAMLCTAASIAGGSMLGADGVLIAATVIACVWLFWLFDRPARLHQPTLPTRRGQDSATTQARSGASDEHDPSAAELQRRRALVEASKVVAQSSAYARDLPILGKAAEPVTSPQPDKADGQAPEQAPPQQAPSTGGTPRQWRPAAAHYDRHRGAIGWLYVARNDFHRDGLYKLGYTTVGVEGRMAKMNNEFAASAHAGEFKALFNVLVQSSRDDELRLFALLDDYRVSKGCEFFMLPLGFVMQAMNVVASRSGVSDLLKPRPAIPPELDIIRRGAQSVAGAPLLADGWGMVVVLRNEAYRPDIYRLGHTKSDLFQYKARLDSEQRRHTSQIGFFSVVAAWPTMSQRAVLESALVELANCRLGRTSFVNTPLEQLKAAIERCVSSAATSAGGGAYQVRMPPENRSPRGDAAVRPSALSGQRVGATSGASSTPAIRTLSPPETRPLPAPGEPWMTNTCPYPRCFQTVRAAGPNGATGWLRCVSCGRPIEYEVADGALRVSREHL